MTKCWWYFVRRTTCAVRCQELTSAAGHGEWGRITSGAVGKVAINREPLTRATTYSPSTRTTGSTASSKPASGWTTPDGR
jgi:hypothetical protein